MVKEFLRRYSEELPINSDIKLVPNPIYDSKCPKCGESFKLGSIYSIPVGISELKSDPTLFYCKECEFESNTPFYVINRMILRNKKIDEVLDGI
jgi:hypothetical protein